MMPSTKPARLRHVLVRVRVSVDPARWAESHPAENLEDEVRRFVVSTVTGSDPAIVSVRRDQR